MNNVTEDKHEYRRACLFQPPKAWLHNASCVEYSQLGPFPSVITLNTFHNGISLAVLFQEILTRKIPRLHHCKTKN